MHKVNIAALMALCLFVLSVCSEIAKITLMWCNNLQDTCGLLSWIELTTKTCFPNKRTTPYKRQADSPLARALIFRQYLEQLQPSTL